MEWRPTGWSMCLPLLIFPCITKSRSSLLAPARSPGWTSRRKGRKAVVVSCVISRCTWTRPTASIVSTSRRRRLAPSWRPRGLGVLPAAASGRAATAAARTASAAAVAFDRRAPRASDARTCNRCRPVAVDGQYRAARAANPHTSDRCFSASLAWRPLPWFLFLA